MNEETSVNHTFTPKEPNKNLESKFLIIIFVYVVFKKKNENNFLSH